MNLPEDTDAILTEMKSKRYLNYTTTIKRAVALFKYVLDAQDEGNGFAIVDKNGKVLSRPRIF